MKRALDLIVVLLTAPIWLALLSLTAILVRCQLGSPVVFRQQRPGLHGRLFTLCKFRTMTNAHDSQNQLLPDSQRLTRFGKLLRSTSLDELPELWNVLKGDMSLVGPRPLLTEYLPLYSILQHRRHEVMPGITGWAQVKGRNALSWETRLNMDIWYVDNRSLLLDIKILFLTVIKVIRREGISSERSVTMEKFSG